MCDVRISFVIATCNGASYIEEQIKSILQYLDYNDEIVVCDDASHDNTVEVIEGISEERVRIFRFHERVGYQKNFERAVNRAKGRFIFFADQDDVCLPSRISASLGALLTKGCVFGDAMIVDQDLTVQSPSYFEGRSAPRTSLVRLFFKPAAIGATMACTKEFLDQSMPFSRRVPHDHLLSCLAAWKGELAIINAPVIKYRRHPSAISATGQPSRRPLSVIVWERILLLYALISKLSVKPREW